MKKILLVLSVAAFMLTSCGESAPKKLSLVNYNETVITVFNAASEKMAEEREIIFDNTLSKEENQKLIDGLNKSLDSCITIMNGLNYPDEAKDFHESMLKLYHYEKDTIMPLLSKTLTFEPKSKEWYATWREFDKKTERVDEILDEMEKLQQEMAKKANATLR